MNVAIVHYHLRGGGVTRVIDLIARELTALGLRVAVFSGEPSREPPAWPVAVVEALRYGGNGTTPAGIADDLATAAKALFGTPADIWHFHNHALGKNPALTAAVDLMACNGETMLLQLHDFAEDGRPDNLHALADFDALYPFSPRIRLAFVNQWDLALFRAAGLPESSGLVLPNPIESPTPAAPPEGPPLVLYPVRAIERKNLPEFLLLAALAPEGARFAVTRAPENSAELAKHAAWEDLARSCALPLDLAVVDRLKPPGDQSRSYGAWAAASTHFASTSVREGFGLTFLEGIAAGRPVIGRNLPRVIQDHIAAGLVTDWLYDRLLVDGIDFPHVPDEMKTRVIRSPRDFSIIVEKAGTRIPASEWLAGALANRCPASQPVALARHAPSAVARICHALYAELAKAPRAPIRHVPAPGVRSAFALPFSSTVGSAGLSRP